MFFSVFLLADSFRLQRLISLFPLAFLFVLRSLSAFLVFVLGLVGFSFFSLFVTPSQFYLPVFFFLNSVGGWGGCG